MRTPPWPRPLPFIALGGLMVGVLDGLYATIFWNVWRGTEPQVIFQSIAAGILGRSAFSGGAATAWMGAGLRLAMATAIAGVYWAGCRRFPAIVGRPATWGPIYGAVVYLVMNHVVVPLSNAVPVPFLPVWFVGNLAGHLVVVGLPLAVLARALASRRQP